MFEKVRVVHGVYQNWPWKVVIDGATRTLWVHELGDYKWRNEAPASVANNTLRQWAVAELQRLGYGQPVAP